MPFLSMLYGFCRVSVEVEVVEVEVVVEVVAVEEGEEAVVLMQVHRLRLKN